jgi:Holliday junction resolvase RusA-like endonuclease
VDAGTAPLFADYPVGFPAAEVFGRAVNLRLFIPASKEEDRPVEPLHRHRVKIITPAGQKPRPQMYADPRSAKWEQYVAETALEQLMHTPTTGAGQDFMFPLKDMRVLATLRFNLPKPKSYPARVVWHTKKPDVDNYGKAILDGLVKARILEDDGMVTDEMTLKRYVEPGHPEGVEIDLTAVPCEVP